MYEEKLKTECTMGRRTRNTVIVSNGKIRFTYALTFDQLEEFLDRFLDIIILNETDEDKFHLRIASSVEGIIINEHINEKCFEILSKYINEL